jgi:hypothetical protein
MSNRAKKRASATRNIIRLFLLLGIFSVMIVAVQYLRRDPVFILPELREEIAARRASPENAYPDLQAAASLMQINEETLRSLRGGGRSSQHTVAFGERLFNRLQQSPGDDTGRMALALQEAAIEATRKTLDQKTVYLFTQPNTIFTTFMLREENPIYDLAHILLCKGLVEGQSQETLQEAFDLLIDAVRLTRLASEEVRLFSPFPRIESDALQQITVIAQTTNRPEDLEYLQARLEAIGAPYPDPRQDLEDWWRWLDDTLEAPLPVDSDDMGPRIGIRFLLWRLQARMKEIARDKDKWYDLVVQRPDEVALALEDERSTSRRRPGRDEFTPAYQMRLLVNRIARARAAHYATLQAIALLRYRLDEGAFPDTLDALVPQYLPELPKDPYTDAPFCYLKTETGCQVYSRGDNTTDNNAHPRNDMAIVTLTG